VPAPVGHGHRKGVRRRGSLEGARVVAPVAKATLELNQQRSNITAALELHGSGRAALELHSSSQAAEDGGQVSLEGARHCGVV